MGGGQCPAGPPAVPAWAGSPSQVQVPTTSTGQTSELVVTFPGDLPGSPTEGRGVSAHPSEPSSSAPLSTPCWPWGVQGFPAPDVPAGRPSPSAAHLPPSPGTCTACSDIGMVADPKVPCLSPERCNREHLSPSPGSQPSGPTHTGPSLRVLGFFPSPAFSPLVSWVH